MGIITGIMVYWILWWLVLFMVLPWGVRTQEAPQKGHASSAPENPRLLPKALATTIIAGLIWYGVYLVLASDLFQDISAAP